MTAQVLKGAPEDVCDQLNAILNLGTDYDVTLLRSAAMYLAYPVSPGIPPVNSFLLMETGDFLLLESGDKIILE